MPVSLAKLSEREMHQIIEDAFAAIRLYRRHYASAQPMPDRIREIVQILKVAGELTQHGAIITNAADAISKTYLGQPLDALE